MKLARSLSLLLLFSISTACSSNPDPQVNPQTPEEKPPEPITLKVTPQISMAGFQGATIRIDYRIARHPDNRSYRLTVGDEGSEIYGHERSLDGERERVQFNPIFIDNLYEGSYKAVLTLTRSEGGVEKKYIATKTFSVQ